MAKIASSASDSTPTAGVGNKARRQPIGAATGAIRGSSSVWRAK
jgi:hypothetical protein